MNRKWSTKRYLTWNSFPKTQCDTPYRVKFSSSLVYISEFLRTRRCTLIWRRIWDGMTKNDAWLADFDKWGADPTLGSFLTSARFGPTNRCNPCICIAWARPAELRGPRQLILNIWMTCALLVSVLAYYGQHAKWILFVAHVNIDFCLKITNPSWLWMEKFFYVGARFSMSCFSTTSQGMSITNSLLA